MIRKAAKRELIAPHRGNKQYVRRKAGKFTTSQDDVSKTLLQNWRRKAKTVVTQGPGDKGDRKSA